MISILSNINLEPVWKKVKKEIECTENIGYGNVLETLLNPLSQVNQRAVDAIFIIMDMRELLSENADFEFGIPTFFTRIEGIIKSGIWYFVSDADFYMPSVFDYKGSSRTDKAVKLYNQELNALCEKYQNICIFPYQALVRKTGEANFYAMKSWYLGSVRHSLEGIKAISEEMLRIVERITKPAKKLLIVDLDNTLWGGVLGEDGQEGIILSDSRLGKAYKDFQESLKSVKDSGVLLAISSKNNEPDVLPVLENHPHMLLRGTDFISKRINWNVKSQSIKEITEELNIGLDSVVFVDDSDIERAEVMAALPMVSCPQMPSAPEKLVEFVDAFVQKYFKRIVLTDEDLKKGMQYEAKLQIDSLQKQANSFEMFLESLQIKIEQRDPKQNRERVVQLLQKTNQFNTALKRYSYQEVEEMLKSPKWQFFLYEISDKFSNHGLCVLAVVSLKQEIAVIENFLMSCRVMGRNIEYTVLERIEEALKELGIQELQATYRYGPKNIPVENLYESAGFKLAEKSKEQKNYRRRLEEEV